MLLNTTELYDRDLSWLRFNHRVLQEAMDKRNPLYERIKFLAIYSSNLDEFFKVRVAYIKNVKKLDKDLQKKLVSRPKKLLKEINKEVNKQQLLFGQIFRNELLPALKEEGIHLINYREFAENVIPFVEAYYNEHFRDIVPIITKPDDSSPQIFVENEQLYLVGSTSNGELIWVKIDSKATRFIQLPDSSAHYVTFVDDILKYNLQKTYGSSFYAVKVSRDAELYIDNEFSGNLLEKIKNSLSNRDTGKVTRILFDNQLPKEQLAQVISALGVEASDIVPGGPYHNNKDFFAFPNPTQKKLSYENLPPKVSSDMEATPSMFRAIRTKDRLLHFPYESFDTLIKWIEEAAHDEKVTKIKITFYRISKDSSIAKALIAAAEKGKEVWVFMETKARFDEANNIKWGKILEDSGANVRYSYPGIKVHSKIMYIERVENEKIRGYGYVGTGNFNESTSKIYTDLSLMTANKKITTELLQVFDVLERNLIIPNTSKLLVSPFTTRSTFTSLIQGEIANALAGKRAYIILKLNSLQDIQMIRLLYTANNAGVKIRLLIRGVCCLVPGIPGQSEHITVTSIVDRFLEHARVYIFANGGEEVMCMGSADWMTRNLDHRIEVITPILDETIYKKIRDAVDLQLNDTVKARIIDANQSNHYVKENDEGKSSQHLIYDSVS